LGQGTNNSNQAADNEYGMTPAKYRGFYGLTLEEQKNEFGKEFKKLENDALKT
jgi:hypothetical protein